MDHGVCRQICKAPTAKHGLVTLSIFPIRSIHPRGAAIGPAISITTPLAPKFGTISAGYSSSLYWQASLFYGSSYHPLCNWRAAMSTPLNPDHRDHQTRHLLSRLHSEFGVASIWQDRASSRSVAPALCEIG